MPIAVDRGADRTARIRVSGDLAIPVAGSVYDVIRDAVRRGDVDRVVVDLGETGRLDGAGAATILLGSRLAMRAGKSFVLDRAAEHHRAALALVPEVVPVTTPHDPSLFERIGEYVLIALDSTRALFALVADIAHQCLGVVLGHKRVPRGAFSDQIIRMGVDALLIVSLLTFLLGTTVGFQVGTQMQQFGATPFVADLIGVSMVRELAPLMTAIIVTGRTGAAIAAELGTMQVHSEIDALTAMGISPTRYLVLPRLAALTIVQPALALIAMFVGILGGLIVASVSLDLTPAAFWGRVVLSVDGLDLAYGLVKSIVFAWIIGLTGSHLGLRAFGDAAAVGRATTHTVVASIFFIVVVDATFATSWTIMRLR